MTIKGWYAIKPNNLTSELKLALILLKNDPMSHPTHSEEFL